VNGTWDVMSANGKLERVRPQDITTTALFSVEGELDDISGSGQTEAVHGICSGVVDSEQKHLIVEGAGHYGIFSGRRWREVVYPQVKAFILAHQPVPVDAKPLSTEKAVARAQVRAPAPRKAVATKKPRTVAAAPVVITPPTAPPATMPAEASRTAKAVEAPVTKPVVKAKTRVGGQPVKAAASKATAPAATRAQPQGSNSKVMKKVSPTRKVARAK
jgi:poly(3-hydroxybutyrate) depolymerase